MIYETYLANLKNLPAGALKMRVARPSRLGPSKELLHDWKDGKITWDEYTVRYVNEISSNSAAIIDIMTIVAFAKRKDVFIYCYEKNPPCHRFILLDIIKKAMGNV